MFRLFTKLAPAAPRTEVQPSVQVRRFLTGTSESAGDTHPFSRAQPNLGASSRFSSEQTPRTVDGLQNCKSGDSASPLSLPGCPELFKCDVGQVMAKQYAQIEGLMSKQHSELKSDMTKTEARLESVVGRFRDELKSDMTGVKTELKGDIRELKSDMTKTEARLESVVGRFRDELKSDMTGVKTELKGDIRELKSDMTGVKTELKGDIRELKSDMAEKKRDLNSTVGEITKEVKNFSRKTYILVGSGMLTVPLLIDQYKSFMKLPWGAMPEASPEPSQLVSRSADIGKVEQKK
ncbi:unnamed protein product [Tuber aestivum]|uniref:Uncharacterized protein n=1 Tax=Tuber aestivum TaxID=59557 RepID=A0A292PNS5_9PEZI|nr:unnamed protein product [Tuber aestivum]